MEALLGFDLDLWDYLTFLTLMLCVVALIATWLFLAGLPGRIALARKHPEAEAVKYLGYAGLSAHGLSVDAGADLGLQADRHRRHPAFPPRGSHRNRQGDRPLARHTRLDAREAVKESTQEVRRRRAEPCTWPGAVVQGSEEGKP
jgi:hypothetical protein